MRRRGAADDEEPAVELWGAEPESATTHRVELGGRRSLRLPVVVAVLAVVGLIAAGLVLGDADDPGQAADEAAEEADGGATTTERERSTSTSTRRSTTTVAPTPTVAPFVGLPAQLLLAGGPGRPRLLDLATLQVQDVELDLDDQPIAVRGGIVAFSAGRAWYRPLPEGEPVDLGTAHAGHAAAGDASSVWLLDSAAPGLLRSGVTVRSVSLATDHRTEPAELGSLQIHGPVLDGLVGSAAGRVYVVGVDGSVRPIATGTVIGVSDGVMLLHTCDDRAQCVVEAWARDLGGTTPIQLPEEGALQFGASLAVQPGGTLAVLKSYGPSTDLFVIDLLGGPPRTIDGVRSVDSVVWLPDDLGLVLARSSELLLARDDGSGGFVLEQLASFGSSQVLLIAP